LKVSYALKSALGKEMDFVRNVLLVLCISLLGANVASARGFFDVYQEGPARASSSHDTSKGSIVQSPSRRLAANDASSTNYYGAPYILRNTYNADGSYDSVAAAANAWWAGYRLYWNAEYGYLGPLEQSCSYTIALSTPSDSNSGYAAGFILGGYCGGGNPTYATAYPYAPGKNNGPPCTCAGDPIDLGTGNEYRDDEDASLSSLGFHRYYNSHPSVASSHVGANWRHSFDRSLEFLNGGTSSNSVATVFRPDGVQVVFTLQSSTWTTDPDVSDRLTSQTDGSGNITGWTYFDSATRNQESYDANGFLLSITTPNGQSTTLTYSNTSTPSNVAPAAGLLLTVTDPRGRTLNFTYNAQATIATVTLPDGGVLNYAYDTSNHLVTVTYPDTKTRQYVYNESTLTGGNNLPNSLTGDIDETNTRLTSISYDAEGRATQSVLPGSVELTQVAYNSDSTTTVTYPTGAQTTLGFIVPNGSVHANSVSAPCGADCGQPNAAATFDANGYVASTTDFNGNLTKTTYDTNGLLDQQIDASGSASQRTITTIWDTTQRVPLTRSVTDANGVVKSLSSWVYNTRGQPWAECEMDPAVSGAASYTCSNTGTVPVGVRRTTYTYCESVNAKCPLIGLMLTSTGPRTDLIQTTTYSYYTTSSATNCGTPGSACYRAGDLKTIKDPLGHVTTIASYDGAGRITRITNANGVKTDSTYSPRGWLLTHIFGGATTTLTYTAYGAVQTVKDPDGHLTTYGYDTAHRLTDITDAVGNTIHYTLDAAGNKTAEQTFNSSKVAVKSLARSFNTLGQLTAITDGLKQTVFNASYSDSYDADGNLAHTADALGTQQKLGYDALNRLVNTIENYNGSDPATQNSTTALTFDALDRTTNVQDPTSLNTGYSFDGLSNRTALNSPDTGNSTDTFDAAGNRLTHTDAKDILATSTYDALNRLKGTTYADTSANVSYTYDEANSVTGCSTSSPIGRLTRVIENTVTTVFCYDARGNVLQKSQTASGFIDVTQYAFTAGDRLKTLIAPDGTVTTYARDTDGRVSSITVKTSGASSASNIATAITWMPFGPVKSYKLGNGQTVTRTYDANYRVTDVTSPALALHFALDATGNITALGAAAGANPATETYHYDPLYHLKDATESSGTALESYTYNSTGDRLSKAAGGLAVGAYLYTSGTHQLHSVGNATRANDVNGNTTGDVIGGNTYGFAYNSRNRLSLAQNNGATVGVYTYNARGQRIGKEPSASQPMAERYAYDENNGLIGEYGTTNRDYIWLGNVPVAVIDNTTNGSVTTSVVNYVHADGLNTPRAVTNSAGTVIWQWAYQGNPFGEQQPTSTAGYVLNLRYPGQYFDAETGTDYNLFRTYEPATGRYLQSDPIGLSGGVSTFAYVGGDPLSYTDPLGLRYVDVYIWDAEGSSVGHVMVTEDGSQQVILSQFPANGMPIGQNMTKSFGDTMAAEGRPADSVWRIDVPNDNAFDQAAAHERGLSHWSWDPSKSSTQCSIAASRSLRAGGVGLTSITDGTLMPGFFGNNIQKNQSNPGNDIKKISP
jgi:RHS repeat-associated protein